jgi:hypothetical protein
LLKPISTETETRLCKADRWYISVLESTIAEYCRDNEYTPGFQSEVLNAKLVDYLVECEQVLLQLRVPALTTCAEGETGCCDNDDMPSCPTPALGTDEGFYHLKTLVILW